MSKVLKCPFCSGTDAGMERNCKSIMSFNAHMSVQRAAGINASCVLDAEIKSGLPGGADLKHGLKRGLLCSIVYHNSIVHGGRNGLYGHE